jgi:signal transduction histidine kinase
MRVVFFFLIVILIALVIYGINNIRQDKPLLADLTNYPGEKEKVISEYEQKVIELKKKRQLLENRLVNNFGKLTESQQSRLSQIDQEIEKLDSLVNNLRTLKKDEELAGSYYWAKIIYGNADKITQTLAEDTLPVKPEKFR